MKPFLIILVVLLLAIFSCEELEPTNPADPSFTLKAPTLITAHAISDIRIDLTWQNNEEHTEEFVIQRKTDDTQYERIASINKEMLFFSDTTCELGTEYTYTILSKVEDNLSNMSNSFVCFTSFPAPTEMIVTPRSEDSTHISWIDNSAFEKGYRVERDSGIGFEHVVDLGSDATEYMDCGLEYGIDYLYRVAGFTSSNLSNWTISNATKTQLSSPSDLLTAAISETQIVLNWTDNCGDELGYRIEREYWDEPSEYHSGFTEIANLDADVTHYLDTNVFYNVKFIYRVAGYAEDDVSDWATSNPTLTFPTAPTNLSATVLNDSEVELSWMHSSYYVDRFIVERDSGSGFVEIAELGYNVGEDEISFSDSYISMDTRYIYRIACFDGSNISDYSVCDTAIVLAPLIDYDGYVYSTVMIGNQIWMAENLRVRHYQNGTAISNVTDGTEWANLVTGAYCAYGNLTGAYFGLLYNHYAIEDNQNIAPEGWHVATDEDWRELEIHLGMSVSEANSTGYRGSDQGTQLKYPYGWFSNGSTNVGSNESGFAALGGGYREITYGDYYLETYLGAFWTATTTDTEEAWGRELGWSNPQVERSNKNKQYGYSVRCVKD